MPASLRISQGPFSVQKGTTKKAVSHKQNIQGSDKNQTWSDTLVDEGK